MKTPKEVRLEAKEIIDEHLEECVSEILEWHDTGTLRDGKVVESMISRAAMQSVLKDSV